ncbi:MAG: type I DNA topoisomerase [Candidatus Zambryskibacteria bacterium CG_4_9_14_3_um_filter_40_16]|uniref:DNA topoisomerase 1 n=2 Tax=Candidatus Zambryskiibacteriota TaxID=1817925 RepID=A0A2M7WVF7_9BACT|nr:MAG: type I DNA topoisomerase [Candidatus Zambryskibacteria bacterium CG_4_9_14_3_um_filter_40_16]
MKLLIVESPAKAKTISKYLDDKYEVVASVGHIRDLPKSNKKAIDIDGGFIPHYETVKGKEKIINEIKKLASGAEEVVLATDPDREGEAIAWHISEAIGLKKPKRVVFYEITKEAVTEAIKHPRDIDNNLKTAQEARRVLDRLVGYDLSGLIWKKVRYGLSAGRVQSPALRIIMEREREIRSFVPEKFWVLSSKLKSESCDELIFVCEKEPRDENEVNEILEKAKKESWSVVDIKETEVKRAPRAPFITSTLQQSASTRFGFSPSKTMSVAQKLYEQGLITYMRTDSTNLSAVAKKQIEEVVSKKFGKNLFENKVYGRKSKNAQEAHEAIRPSNILKEGAGNTEEQKKLYFLIWQRTVASQMIDAKVLRTKVTANIQSKSIPNFALYGSRVLSPGWLLADPHAKKEDVELPKIQKNEDLELISIDSEGKETLPPPRYSEAGLIKELEKRGIGRPSTYASIIRTLIDRGYVVKEQRALLPTDTGDVVSTFLENNFTEYISDSFTALMENELDDIANGKRNYEKTLKDFYVPFQKEIKSKDKLEKITNLGKADPKLKCPKCQANMIIKLSKSGKFLSCERFPDCTGARTIDGEELAGPKDTGELCPECGKANLIERDGKFGRFIACSRYPKCKFVKEDPETKKKLLTGVKCPVCKDGEMMERRGRFGIFYSCSNYPACKHAIKAKPTGKFCELCNSLMMEGTKTIPERCSVKSCENHNPHKLMK